MVLLVTAAAAVALGKITSQVLAPAMKYKYYLLKKFFCLGPTENYPAGSWNQQLYFLLAISSLFSHVHLSNQCGDVCQERFLFDFFKNSILEYIFERKSNI